LIHSDNDIDPDIGRWIDERIRVNRAIKHDGTHFTKYLDSLFPEKDEVTICTAFFVCTSRLSITNTPSSCLPQGHEKGGFELSLTADVDYLRKVLPLPLRDTNQPLYDRANSTIPTLQENMYLQSIDVDTGAEKDGACALVSARCCTPRSC